MDRRRFSKLALGSAALPLFARADQPGVAPRLSCMLWTLQKLATFDRALEMVAEAGYQGVELVGEFQRWSPEEMGRITARLRTLRLVADAASGIKTGFAVPGAGEVFLREFQEQLKFMEQLGCRRVILLSGPVVAAAGAAAQRETAVANLSKAAELAALQQVEIVIEPIDPLENPTIFLQSVAEAFPLVRAVNRLNVKVLYDLYHEQRGFGNLLEKLEKNVDLIGLIHVADVPGRHEPGTGEIDYEVIYRKLAALRYGGWIAMEFYPTGDPVTALRTARLAVAAAYRA